MKEMERAAGHEACGCGHDHHHEHVHEEHEHHHHEHEACGCGHEHHHVNMGMESMNTITMSTKQRHPGRRFQCRRVLKREFIYLRIWVVPTVPPRWSA